MTTFNIPLVAQAYLHLPAFFQTCGAGYTAFADYSQVTATEVQWQDSEDGGKGWYVIVYLDGFGPAEIGGIAEEQLAIEVARLVMSRKIQSPSRS